VSSKSLIWIGAIIGSTIGGLVPGLWHASLFSLWGILLSTGGGAVGIWAGWKIGRRLQRFHARDALGYDQPRKLTVVRTKRLSCNIF